MLARLAYNLPHYVRAARAMPLALLMIRVAARAGLGSWGPVRRATLLNNRAFMDPERIERLFGLLETAAQDHLDWAPLELADKHILEVGCGPLAGFAPLAILRGASKYEGFDPSWNAADFDHKAMVERFLRPAHTHLNRQLEIPIEFAQLRKAIAERCTFSSGGIETRASDQPVDLVASLSCLEHISDIAGAMTALSRATSTSTRHLHLVNFSNHQSKDRPFDNLYDLAPDEHRRRYGPHINLLRPSEIAEAFRAAGLACRMAPVSVVPEALEGLNFNSAWQRFPVEELAIRTALFAIEPSEQARRN